MRAWSLIVCLAINGYLLGVMVLFAAVVYPGFGAVEKSAFPPHYAAFTSRIGAPVVAFEFLALVATLVLYAFRPASTPLGLVHVLVALGVAYFAITFAWHLPAHRALTAGDNSPAALSPLIISQWARTVVHLARTTLLVALATRP